MAKNDIFSTIYKFENLEVFSGQKIKRWIYTIAILDINTREVKKNMKNSNTTLDF